MIVNNILQSVPSWLADGSEGDVVLSCRMRLARNLTSLPFPAQANEEQLASVLDRVGQVIDELKKEFNQDFALIKIEQLQDVERFVLVEKHLISPLQAIQPKQRGVIVSQDNSISIMLNEEDHLRIQVMLPGLDLQKGLEIANKIDNILEQYIDFAFDDNFGYLTACPTNIGTALRASAMLHMPGLVISGQVDNMARAAAQVGLIVRGMYGEGSASVGDVFQVSNQLAMGYSENELVESMTDMVKQIASQERKAREHLMKTAKINVEDMVWRAYGTLLYARKIENSEAMNLFSKVLLGIDLDILSLDKKALYELMVNTRPNHMQKNLSKREEKCTQEELRSIIVRQKLTED